MGNIQGQISAAPGVTGYMVYVLYKTTNAGAEVTRLPAVPAPHLSPFTFEFTNLAAGNYIVKVFESVDGTTLGNIRHDYWQNTNSDKPFFQRTFFTVNLDDTDSFPNNKDFIDAGINGQSITGLFKEGSRYLKDAVEWQTIAGGGIRLLGDQEYAQDTTYSYEILTMVDDGVIVTNDAFSILIPVPSNLTVNSSHYNKTLLCNSSAPTQLITLPLVSTVADGKGLVIAHDGGNAINVAIKAQTGEIIRFRGSNFNVIWLGVGEKVKIIQQDDVWHVVDDQGQWDRLGEIVPGFVASLPNAIKFDGTEYDGNVYLRAWDIVKNHVSGAQKVNYTDWELTATFSNENFVKFNYGLFAVDLTNSKFKTPNLQNMSLRFLKNIGGADSSRTVNVPGGYQHHQVGQHTIDLNKGNGYTGTVQTPLVFGPGQTGTQATAHVDQQVGKETITRNTGAIPFMLI